jgi:endonuclease/exonuclease/phosphatase family metal-dependent hydrolase
MRILVFVSVLGLLVACSESSSPLGPTEVTVDTFNVALAGAFIPYEAERRQPIIDAIEGANADILCLQEVWEQSDKDMIKAAVEENYPHVVSFEDGLDTPVDDPTDQNGEVPESPEGVPCADVEPDDPQTPEGDTMLDQMNDACDCLRDNCSTIEGSDEGRTESAECASSSCVPAVAPLLFGDDPRQQRCYACVITQLPTETIGDIRSRCATIENQDLAFRGQNGVMILSRHPLSNATNWVIPGTWNRRNILSATARLPNGVDLDVYCNHLTPIFDGGAINTFPYTGQYGLGGTGPDGWQAEQELQAQKLVDHVSETSGNRPAVILGDFNAGRDFLPDIVAEGEPTVDILESAFEMAYTADYEPLCTFCSTNPVTDTENSVWIDHILLHNLSADVVLSTERVYDEDVVDVGEEQMVPLSDHFGMRSVIVVQ